MFLFFVEIYVLIQQQQQTFIKKETSWLAWVYRQQFQSCWSGSVHGSCLWQLEASPTWTLSPGEWRTSHQGGRCFLVEEREGRGAGGGECHKWERAAKNTIMYRGQRLSNPQWGLPMRALTSKSANKDAAGCGWGWGCVLGSPWERVEDADEDVEELWTERLIQ